MRTKILILLILISRLSIAQDTQQINLKNTEQFKLDSQYFTGEPFTIQVCFPRNYDSSKVYPVVYLLDADKSIGMAKEISDWLSFGGEINRIIIVGIAYDKDEDTWWKERTRDFFPTSDTISDFGKHFPEAGGADNFLDFIEYDLKPEIEKRYKTDKSNSGLIGFSAGGLLATYTLFKRPYLFDNYIIISPSMIWDHFLMLKAEDCYFQTSKELNKNVFISYSSDDPAEYINDPTQKLIEVMKSRNYSGLKLTHEYFENETHFTGYPRGLATGLKRLYLYKKL